MEQTVNDASCSSIGGPHADRRRFAFGRNWRSFLAKLDEQRIEAAARSLTSMLGLDHLHGLRFLDIGSGSGLASLAARRLGARVWSIDADPEAVACTSALKARFFPDDPHWTITRGSILDEQLVRSLGQFDVVYAWGVLHHTGDLWRSLDLTLHCLAQGGLLYVAIYNDQGGASRRWLRVKQLYNRLPRPLQPLLVLVVAGWFELLYGLVRLTHGRNPLPFDDWRQKKRERGMSAWHDWVDWIGGLPFDVARPEEVIVPLRRRGLVLENLKTCGSGHGCNEYVFRRLDWPSSDGARPHQRA